MTETEEGRKKPLVRFECIECGKKQPDVGKPRGSLRRQKKAFWTDKYTMNQEGDKIVLKVKCLDCETVSQRTIDLLDVVMWLFEVEQAYQETEDRIDNVQELAEQEQEQVDQGPDTNLEELSEQIEENLGKEHSLIEALQDQVKILDAKVNDMRDDAEDASNLSDDLGKLAEEVATMREEFQDLKEQVGG